MSEKSETTWKRVLEIAHCFLTMSLIVSMLLVAPVISNIKSVQRSVETIQTVQLPKIRDDIIQLRTQNREMRVHYDTIRASLQKISNDLQYIRRKLEN